MTIILFHGTSKSRGEKILNDGCLKASGIDRVYDKASGVPTTDNQIYLSQSLSIATYYGQKTSLIYDYDDSMYVFRVKINKRELLPDYDEVKYTINKNSKDYKMLPGSLTIDKSLSLTGSVAYPRNICVKDFSILYSLLKISGDNNQKQLINKLVSMRNKNFNETSGLIDEISSKLSWKEV